MNYSAQELHQALVRLFTLMNAKITCSANPNPTDFEFLTHLRGYIDRISKNSPKEKNTKTKLHTQLRSFLRRAKPWEKMNTTIPDVSIIKVPMKKPKIAALHLVIDHMKRELDFKTNQVFQRLKEIFVDSRINSLMKEIDQVNKMKIRLNN